MQLLDSKLKRYIALTSGEAVKSIIDPILKNFGVSYFLYIKSFPDGTRLWLTNRGEWTEHYYERAYYTISAFEDVKRQYLPGYFLWSTLTGQEVYQDAKKYFHIDHGITVVHQLEDAYEFVHLGATPQDSHIINFYLNNINIINQFILYFRDKGGELIKQAHLHKLSLPQNNILSRPFDLRGVLNEQKKKLIVSNLPVNKKYLSSLYDNQYLTARELECIEWLKNGKTAHEIALILNISHRTVEAHINHLKAKLGCHTLFQLGYKLSQIDFTKV